MNASTPLKMLAPEAQTPNPNSQELSHTRILAPGEDPVLVDLAARLGPHIVSFGELMFGESLPWLIKEMWVNVLLSGGRQAVHNHANCFVSGVLYLTETDPSAQTVFLRGMGGRDFVFSNTHAESSVGAFNADKWVAPALAAGDLLLFPSYLLHEVPINRGGRRVTLAFNAIPRRLDAWGYSIGFSGPP